MPDERTSLLPTPMGPPTMRVPRPPDLRHAAFCTALKFVSYVLKYIAFFLSSSRHSFVGDACNFQGERFWWQICRSFEAAVHKVFQAVFTGPEQSADADAAASANRKGTSVPDYFQALLGLVDQTITISIGFAKAGWRCGPAIGGGMVVTILPYVVQELTNGDVVDKVTRHRRAKEKIGSDETHLFLYGESSQKLKDWDSNRRTVILISLGVLIELIELVLPSEPHDFTRVLPFVSHTDEKLGKMFKARAEVSNAWPFLKARFSAADETVQTNTYNSASRLCQKVLVVRQRFSGAAISVAVVRRIWRVGSEHKVDAASKFFERVRSRGTDATWMV